MVPYYLSGYYLALFITVGILSRVLAPQLAAATHKPRSETHIDRGGHVDWLNTQYVGAGKLASA